MVKNKLEGAQIRGVKVSAENITSFRDKMFNTQGSESYDTLCSIYPDLSVAVSQDRKTALPIQAAGSPREAGARAKTN